MAAMRMFLQLAVFTLAASSASASRMLRGTKFLGKGSGGGLGSSSVLVQQQPVYVQPTYVQPTYVQPTYVQPTYVQPTYVQPTYVQPVYYQPQVAPVYSSGVMVAPAYTQSYGVLGGKGKGLFGRK